MATRAAEGFSGGKSQMDMMHLLIKTQLLICRRYEKQMSRYRYPAYRILLDCISLPDSCRSSRTKPDILNSSLLMEMRADFMLSAVRLLFRTCLVSPLNSEALVAESGVQVLIDLVGFYIEAILVLQDETNLASTSLTVNLDILTELVHTLSGVAFFDTGLTAIRGLADTTAYLVSWRRCVDGTIRTDRDGRDLLIRRYALEGVVNMAKEESLRDGLVGAGVVWPMMHMMLSFDPTLETNGGEQDGDDLGVSVAANNILARLSVRGLGKLTGLLAETAENPLLSESIAVLLTSQISQMLRNSRTGEILRVLNSNVEQANIIWNVRMRKQLEAKLSQIVKERPRDACRSPEDELAAVGDFVFDELKDEPQIGGIYIRVFNNGGREALTRIPNPIEFGQELLSFVAKSINKDILTEPWMKIDEATVCQDMTEAVPSVDSRLFVMVLTALGILVKIDGLLDDVITGSAKGPQTFLSFLDLPLAHEVRGNFLP